MTTTTDHRAAIWWPGWISEGLCVLGLAVSTYLTYEHFNDPGGLACPATGIVNCAKVVTSSYSVVLGVPVPVAGLAYFVAMAVLCSPPAWRSPRPALRRLRLVASLTGAVMIVWLIYVELFRLDAICLWCTSVHVIAVVLFITVAYGTAMMTADTDTDTETGAEEPAAHEIVGG